MPANTETPKHTPGPWWWDRDVKHQGAHNLNSPERPDVDIAIGGSGGYWLLEGVCGNVRARTKADARLIAAAPDLLAACETAVDDMHRLFGAVKDGEEKAAIRRLGAAINKATRGAQDAPYHPGA